MSRTEDRRRAKDASYKGQLAGLYGEPRTTNPYKVGAGSGTWTAWDSGWERGDNERRDQRRNCGNCDPIMLQRVTTRGYISDVELVKVVPGKKPYLVKCKKCGREWKTNAAYARGLVGVGMAERRCGCCGLPKPAQEFGKVGAVEACDACMPGLIAKSSEGITQFTKRLIQGRR